jgi:hypothetical protein
VIFSTAKDNGSPTSCISCVLPTAFDDCTFTLCLAAAMLRRHRSTSYLHGMFPPALTLVIPNYPHGSTVHLHPSSWTSQDVAPPHSYFAIIIVAKQRQSPCHCLCIPLIVHLGVLVEGLVSFIPALGVMLRPVTTGGSNGNIILKAYCVSEYSLSLFIDSLSAVP